MSLVASKVSVTLAAHAIRAAAWRAGAARAAVSVPSTVVATAIATAAIAAVGRDASAASAPSASADAVIARAVRHATHSVARRAQHRGVTSRARPAATSHVARDVASRATCSGVSHAMRVRPATRVAPSSHVPSRASTVRATRSAAKLATTIAGRNQVDRRSTANGPRRRRLPLYAATPLQAPVALTTSSVRRPGAGAPGTGPAAGNGPGPGPAAAGQRERFGEDVPEIGDSGRFPTLDLAAYERTEAGGSPAERASDSEDAPPRELREPEHAVRAAPAVPAETAASFEPTPWPQYPPRKDAPSAAYVAPLEPATRPEVAAHVEPRVAVVTSYEPRSMPVEPRPAAPAAEPVRDVARASFEQLKLEPARSAADAPGIGPAHAPPASHAAVEAAAPASEPPAAPRPGA